MPAMPAMPNLDTVLSWLHVSMFKLGDTEISISRLLGLIVIIGLAWWASARIEGGIRHAARKRTDLASSVYAWARITRYTIWGVGTIVGLNYIGIDLASFALIGGAIGVGIGFGLQNIFSNLISGIILLLEKTLKVGDFVDLQSGTRGHVREIGLRYTRITTNDEVDVIVPNSEFVNGRVVNWTFGSRYRRLHIPFGVAYGSDKQAVKAAGLRAAAAVSHTIEEGRRVSDVWMKGMGDSSLDFELVVWVGAESTSRPSRVEAQYTWAIHDELIAAGLEIPFPQRDLHLRSGEIKVRMADPTSAPAA